jgi:hypothetical protein
MILIEKLRTKPLQGQMEDGTIMSVYCEKEDYKDVNWVQTAQNAVE